MRRTLTGAWIETFGVTAMLNQFHGRTLTGAWIETVLQVVKEVGSLVAPSRVRGLKHWYPPACS